MKRILTVYFFVPVMCTLLQLCCFISCAPPVGNFGGGSGGYIVNHWIIEKVVDDYYVGDSFDAYRDFYISSYESGEEVMIYGNDPEVVVEINPNPDSNIVLSKKVEEQFFPFSEAGKHEVRITYKGSTKRYRITVRGAAPPPGGELSGLGGGIIWN